MLSGHAGGECDLGGRDADERGDALLAQAPEFAQFREEREGGDEPDAGHGLQQREPITPSRIGFDGALQFAFDAALFTLERADESLDALTDDLVAAGGVALPFAADHHLQLSTAVDEVLERVLPFGSEVGHGWAKGAGEVGEGEGVDAVGLGGAADGGGEVAVWRGLTIAAGGPPPARASALASVPTGGFENDAVKVVERLESFDQFGVAAPVGLTPRGRMS